MKKRNHYAWLDQLVSHRLNPLMLAPETLTTEVSQEVTQKIAEEKVKALDEFKEQLFHLQKERHIKVHVKNNYDAVITLINKAYKNSRHRDAVRTNTRKIHEYLMEHLEEIISFIEQQYPEYIDGDYRMPLTRLIPIKELIEENREAMNAKLAAGTHGHAPVYIVQEILDNFIDKVDRGVPISVHQAKYIEDLVHDIINLHVTSTITNCPPLHELLVYWNLNTKTCISYFTHGFEGEIAKFETDDEKLDYIRLQLKNVRQLPVKPETVYDPAYPGIAEYFKGWMRNEIEYMEKKMEGFKPLEEAPEEEAVHSPLKILSTLSIDQIALFLRAAYDAKVIIAKSMNWLFKTLVPFLSTQKRSDISWQSVRTKSYEPEERDKQILIKVLDRLKERIMEY